MQSWERAAFVPYSVLTECSIISDDSNRVAFQSVELDELCSMYIGGDGWGIKMRKPLRLREAISGFCGATRNRTGDTRIFSPLLYQLSYGSIVSKRFVLSVIRLGLEPRTPTLKVLCSTC